MLTFRGGEIFDKTAHIYVNANIKFPVFSIFLRVAFYGEVLL